MPHNAFYAQSGGVTAVINASAAGVIAEAKAHPDTIGTLYAGRDGIIGALTEELIDITAESESDLAALLHTPSGAFGSCRYKLKSIEEHRTQYERLIEVFRAHDIRYFFYNGGGDSQDTAHKVSQLSEKMGFPITCIGVPKTMDNDLPITDCCPGFGSVAKYTAVSILEASFDVASMQRTSTKVFVMEVMGRHAGWVAASAGLARDERGMGPDIILFPEVQLDESRFLEQLDRVVAERGFCMIVVSEGAKDAAGEFLSSSGSTDAFGHAQLGGVAPVIVNKIKQHAGYKCHWAVCDYLQRAARHIASKTDVDQAYELGRAAVRYAVNGDNAVMPVVVRESDQPYRWHIDKAPLSEVANVEKCLPTDFISDDGFHITEKARRYLSPLIEGEAYPPYQNGLPDYRVLNKSVIPKKCAEFYDL
ncbi:MULTISPECIES: 6-phosphofructokinase [unclassified Marinimicrobium]|uniref:6-phosphofructokinase n=1 Tax=unclassified Marinimicrobium TaxID=2632100 RepID=UPI000C641E63|nr:MULTISPECIES: 6-phosphofructokinase [unclassified Marinimicrobium]MAN50726.1 6-phosphofructokinase [Marinimicrobium sp.]